MFCSECLPIPQETEGEERRYRCESLPSLHESPRCGREAKRLESRRQAAVERQCSGTRQCEEGSRSGRGRQREV